MLPDRESLTVEFRSEQRRPQSDDEIVDNIVALANTQGGTLYLGIEDNGTVTGVSEQHFQYQWTRGLHIQQNRTAADPESSLFTNMAAKW